MSNKNQFTGRNAFYRMKYLHQIADMCRQKSGDDYTKLMLHYGSQLVSIGKKTQSRMSPEMKRTICKVCNAILVPGDTEKIRLVKTKRQPDKMKSICVICGTEKVFNLRKDYKLWCEKPESIVKIINTREDIKQNIKFKNKNNSNGESSKSNLNIDKSTIDDLKHFVNSKKNTSDAKSTTVEELKSIIDSDENKALVTKLMTDNPNGDLKDNVESTNDSSNGKLIKGGKSSTTVEDLKNIVNSDKNNYLDLNLMKDRTIGNLNGNLSKTSTDNQKNYEKVDSSEDVDSAPMEIDETSNGNPV